MTAPRRSVIPAKAGIHHRCLTSLALLALAATPAAAQTDSARYAPAIAALDSFVARQMADKGIRAIAVTVVDDRGVVWRRAFGESRPGVRATLRTLYRVDASLRPTMRAMAADTAQGTLWSYDGREWAPNVSAAGDYATIDDLARSASARLASGDRSRATRTRSTGGITTEIALLPNERLGAAVVATVDGAGGVADRVAARALGLVRAARAGRPLPTADGTVPLAAGRALRLAGRYGVGNAAIDLDEYEGRLWLQRATGGLRVELRAASPASDTLIVDDRLSFGERVIASGTGALVVGRDTLRPATVPKPPAIAERWRALIGEYGTDDATVFLLERDGRLHALVDWFVDAPLVERSRDTFAFPSGGPYAGRTLTVARGANGRPAAITIAGVRHARRTVGTEDGSQFSITPLRPVAELRAEALAAAPPHETGTFRASDLVSVPSLDSTIHLDVRYATSNNFMRTPFYSSARAFLQRPAAEAVARASRALQPLGYGLLIHDAYRPWYVTKMFWEGTPPAQRVFVADPAQGSRHNRGAAVDITLYDLRTGREIEMTGGYDELTDRSYPRYPGGTSLQRWHRELLRRAMEAEGFTVYDAEWWHFDYRDWRQYPIGTATFEQMEQRAP